MYYPRKPRAKIHYGNRFEVSAWVPSAELTKLAHERTEGMVGYFLACANRDPTRWLYDLDTLARSCYLQGAGDAAMVAAQMRRQEDAAG